MNLITNQSNYNLKMAYCEKCAIFLFIQTVKLLKIYRIKNPFTEETKKLK